MQVITTPRTYAYTYDPAGNRLTTSRDGIVLTQQTYDAANQVVGRSYDGAGNLLNDGSTAYTYDALGRQTWRTTGGITTTYRYGGTDALLAATVGTTTTTYVQDLAAPLSQVLAISSGGTTERMVYGHERLRIDTASGSAWPLHDLLGSQRLLLDTNAAVPRRHAL